MGGGTNVCNEAAIVSTEAPPAAPRIKLSTRGPEEGWKVNSSLSLLPPEDEEERRIIMHIAAPSAAATADVRFVCFLFFEEERRRGGGRAVSKLSFFIWRGMVESDGNQ